MLINFSSPKYYSTKSTDARTILVEVKNIIQAYILKLTMVSR